MLPLYNAVLTPLRLAAAAYSAWPFKSPRARQDWDERCGRIRAGGAAGGVWLHGASVGEARIVALLAGALHRQRPELPLFASAVTTTGRSTLPTAPSTEAHFLAPLDLPGYPSRTLAALRPRVVALVETELWPNLMHESAGRGLGLVLLNGRLSARRMARYRRLSALYAPLLALVGRLGAQSADDAARFVELGADPARVVVTGNIKYDLPAPQVDAAQLRQRFVLEPGRPVWVAGSTGEGEEALVLDAFERARRSVGELLLVLAPRHPPRSDEVERLLRSRGFRPSRLSAGPRGLGDVDVLLVDTVGELASLYRMADVAFVGGSLVPVGGHNVLEPAAAGVPVLFGPHTTSIAEPAAALVDGGGGMEVADAAELGRRLGELLADPERRETMARRAAATVEANRGALAHSVALVHESLAASLGDGA